jgi:inosose dehydratase
VLTVLFPRLVASILCAVVIGRVSQDVPVAQPQIVAATYVWSQYYGGRGQQLEDHQDEAFAATARAGFNAVQGWLSWYGTDAQAAATAAALAARHLSMPSAYTDGPLHDDRADATIERVAEWAGRGRPHGLRMVVMNPDVRRDGAEKTDDELVVQTRNLDRLGSRLQALDISLAIHAHDKEMRSGAREWYSNLRQTDPARVGVCLDLHWVYRGEQDPATLLRAAGARVLDVHLRNSSQGIWLQDLDRGDIDYAALAEVFRQGNYRGTYTVELAYEPRTRRTRTIEANLRRSREFLVRTFGLATAGRDPRAR